MTTKNQSVFDAGLCHSLPVFVRTFFPHWELCVINEQFYAFHLVRVWYNCGVFWNLYSEPIAGSTQGLTLTLTLEIALGLEEQTALSCRRAWSRWLLGEHLMLTDLKQALTENMHTHAHMHTHDSAGRSSLCCFRKTAGRQLVGWWHFPSSLESLFRQIWAPGLERRTEGCQGRHSQEWG